MSLSLGKIGCSGSGLRKKEAIPVPDHDLDGAFGTLSAGPDWWKRSKHNRANALTLPTRQVHSSSPLLLLPLPLPCACGY